jgi:hypothetical protein
VAQGAAVLLLQYEAVVRALDGTAAAAAARRTREFWQFVVEERQLLRRFPSLVAQQAMSQVCAHPLPAHGVTSLPSCLIERCGDGVGGAKVTAEGHGGCMPREQRVDVHFGSRVSSLLPALLAFVQPDIRLIGQ